MSNVAIKGGATGTATYTIEAPTGNTDRTLTLPDEAGTVLIKNTSGNVGIGTDAPATTLHVKQTTDSLPALQLQHNDGDFILCEENGGTDLFKFSRVAATNDLAINVINSASARFYTNNTERMRIDSSGDVLIGTTATTSNERVRIANGNDTRAISFQSASAAECGYIYINSGGTSVSYSTTSDYRLKENVVDMTGAIDRVKALKPSQFNFIADPDTTVDGFLAHEAQAVVPEAVTGTKDEVDAEDNPVYQGIDQSKLVPLLTGALQEAIARIETLEAEVATLKGASA